MPNAFAISMTKPHETLGLPQPLARRLPQGIVAWNMVFAGLTLAMVVGYVVQVNVATSKGYSLRTVEKNVEALKTDTLVLQDKIASMSSMKALTDRAVENGFVSVDQVEFVTVRGGSYAMAK
ncbi:hypothetical protein KBC59_01930 [Patescibacteria group bacterium]|jgi:hypothetical protein|nr:hypothetical protein [Patescibacteria group bacterium]